MSLRAGPNQEYPLDGGLMQGIEQLGDAAFDSFDTTNWGQLLANVLCTSSTNEITESGFFENDFGLNTGVDQLLWGL